MTARDIAEVARVTGAFIFALCGHKFIPKLNPEKYPVCQACMDIASSIISQDG